MQECLSPIRGRQKNPHIFEDNIAVDDGEIPPVLFDFGEGLHLANTEGKEVPARIVYITGQAILVEYRSVE